MLLGAYRWRFSDPRVGDDTLQATFLMLAGRISSIPGRKGVENRRSRSVCKLLAR
ncbi:hypothetical protein [Tautonia sociabilis]|uniref:hypothetical protein n=1 Tax=Tautonia sociabilis TaxID=2080755 RepID=UPI0013154186|nr:hypothetical protein [Tautonia sociabilis]